MAMARSTKLNIYLDPYIFVCPSPEAGQEKLKEYAESLLFWRDARNAGWANVYHTYRTLTLLNSIYDYNPQHKISEIITSACSDTIPVDALRTMLNTFLQQSTIEDALNINEVLVTDVKLEPCDHLHLRPKQFHEDHERMLALICLARDIQDVHEGNQLFSTFDLSVESTTATIKLWCSIEYEPVKPNGTQLVQRNVESCVRASNGTHGVKTVADPVEIWASATKNDSYRQAIELYVDKEAHLSSTPIHERHSWTFGHKFLESVANLHFEAEKPKIKAMLRACAETILRPESGNIEQFRSGPGANDPQKIRERDAAAAWRRYIGLKGKTGYRLNYWKKGKNVEFSNVERKKEKSAIIYE